MENNLAVFIGRFQPFHMGHLHPILEGLKIAENVLVLIGDTGGPRTIKNPWTFEERRKMIRAALNPDESRRVCIEQIYDMPSDTDWIAQVVDVVNEISKECGANKITLIGHDKDSSSFYLKFFPLWNRFDTGFETLENGLQRKYSATDIRNLIWKDCLHYATGIMHPETLEYLVHHMETNRDTYLGLSAEYKCIQEYRASWASAPFPPIFVTTDCVVVQSGHILLIRRGQNPGKGLWALPGGFIDQSESIESCAIRELLEETEIHLQPEVLRRCIHTVQVFDRAGGVSQEDRGRIITHVHLIKLDDTKPLPKVRGGDDADLADWKPIGDINYREIFSDHGKIIQTMLGKL